MEQYRLRDAAELLGVSYQTLKLWIYEKKIRSVKTPGGHHRIPRSEVERLSGVRQRATLRPRTATELTEISGRNKLLGIVTGVKYAGLLAQVTLDVGGQTVTSIITRDACRALGLKKGVTAYALIKATEVMIIRG
ncbi:MAG TPA: helix-turn-helix transcriptional regulator [Blastocatellia bacterium]|nr:helix-turn-helix transcriptional regulator [Blastocatellia bacterium]